jgi:hypothetical protein
VCYNLKKMFKQGYVYSLLLQDKFLPKISNQFKLLHLNSFFFNNIEFIFKIPSKLENKNRFILMLILMEKFLNNRIIFLYDTHTLSRMKAIKIGCLLNLRNELLYNFLFLCTLHSIPKFYEQYIVFDFLKSNNISYELKKILSNTIFNFDKHINLYYDYLGEFDYSIFFIFRSKIASAIYNQLLLNSLGFTFFNAISMQHIIMIENIWFSTLLVELEENSLEIEEGLLTLEEFSIEELYMEQIEEISVYMFLMEETLLMENDVYMIVLNLYDLIIIDSINMLNNI